MISPSPQCVGQEFVRQYYTMLHEAPDFMHRFYSHDSSFIHGGQGDGSVHGQTNIHKKILSLNFRDCHARIRQVDSLGTIDNAVVVQVSGELSNDGQPMRRFMQTFVLAPQSPKKYYVHNDIFRYQDEVFIEEIVSPEIATPSTSNADSPGSMQGNPRIRDRNDLPDQSSTSVPPSVEEATRHQLTDHHTSSPPIGIGRSNKTSGQPDRDAKNSPLSSRKKEGRPPHNGHCHQESTSEQALVNDHGGGGKEDMDAKENKENGGQTTPTKTPLSWASVMSNKKIQPTVSHGYMDKGKPQRQDKSTPSSTLISIFQESSSPIKKMEDQNSPTEEKSQVDAAAHEKIEGRTAWHSDIFRQHESIQLFVGNLPADISANILRKIFSRYGEVLDVRINRKVSMNREVPNFGFVSFDTVETARRILDARPFHLENGHRLNVEEKKSDQMKFMGGNQGVQHRNRPISIMQAQTSGRAWWGGYRPTEGRVGLPGHSRTFDRFGNGNASSGGFKGKARQD